MKNVSRREAKKPKKQKMRAVYSADSKFIMPGTLARSEGDPPTGDTAVDEAYEGLGIFYDFFWDIYNRNSIDNKGMPLNAVVHYGEAYNNIFWNGRQLIVGDGDGRIFNRYSIAVDIIANALTKGIVQVETNLDYWGQSGALIQSISDVFGSLVKQYFLRQTVSEADWLVGAGLLHPTIKVKALRSLAAPGTAYDAEMLGKDPQVAHMRNYVRMEEDQGGIHINSGIPNLAFYLFAIEIGGYAWEKAGRIWYETLLDEKLKADAQFGDFARITLAKARQLFGTNSDEVKAVKHSWEKVGILVDRG